MADIIHESPASLPNEQSSSRWNFLKTAKERWTRKTSPETPVFVKAARVKLIDNILKQGLLASKTVVAQGGDFLGSIDNEGNPVVFGRVLKPQGQYVDAEIFQNAVNQALYSGDNSCLPVVTERPGESSETRYYLDPRIVAQRAQASFLVVCQSEPDALLQREEQQTTPQDFSYLIFPRQVLADYDQEALARTGIKVKVVDHMVQRSLLGGKKVAVPDYEAAVKEILTELKSPIWMHAVRLPTAEDLKTG